MEQLINKSLVIVEDAGHESRYHLLETIRQYAREKLLDSGEVELVRKKHGKWFLAAASRAEMEYWSGKKGAILLNEFENNHENFRAALDWLLATEKLEDYARLASALGVFWFALGYYQEGQHRLDVGLIHRERLSEIANARILRVLCRILARMGNYDLAITYGEESVTLFRGMDNKTELAWTVDFLADTLSEKGDEDAAGIYYNEALTLYRELGSKSGISHIMLEIGWGQVVAGNFTEGFTNLEEALKLKQDLGEAFGIAYSLFVLATCRWHSQEYDKAEVAAKKGLKVFHQLGDKWFTGGCLTVLAGVSSARHRPQQAAKYMGVFDKNLEAIRGSIPPFWARDVFNPILDSIHEQLNDVEYDKAHSEGYSMTPEQAIAFALEPPEENTEIENSTIPAYIPSQREAEKHKYSGLTTREREVAAQIAQGKSNQAIAAELFVGLKTVEAHVTRILTKLGFTSRAQIAAWAVAKGLAEAPRDLDTLDREN
jgi:non-specific serine/threonine protein kinase